MKEGKDTPPEKIASAVARALAAHRKAQKLTYEALAEKAGISRNAIRFIENEERNPTLLTCLKLSRALGISLAELLSHAEKR